MIQTEDIISGQKFRDFIDSLLFSTSFFFNEECLYFQADRINMNQYNFGQISLCRLFIWISWYFHLKSREQRQWIVLKSKINAKRRVILAEGNAFSEDHMKQFMIYLFPV